VVGVVSQPDRPRGRGRAVRPSPVAALALEHGLPLVRPARVGEPEVAASLRARDPELGVVVAFGQFLPRRIRELPRLGYLINGHASLLPRYRGAAPIAHAILAGDTLTGVSVMRVEREMDAGPVALARTLPIGPDETRGELETRMAALTAEVIAEALDQIASGRVTWTAQDHSLATDAPKIGPADAVIEWSAPAPDICNRIRAMSPVPGARTECAGETLRILAASCEVEGPDRAPGTVRNRAGEPLRVATGRGWLLPRQLQRPGGKPLAVDDYLRGRAIPDGTRLGTGATTG
jgi:methionyl-tRNA formyltransferase